MLVCVLVMCDITSRRWGGTVVSPWPPPQRFGSYVVHPALSSIYKNTIGGEQPDGEGDICHCTYSYAALQWCLKEVCDAQFDEGTRM